MYMTEQSVQRILGYKENRQYLWTEYVPSQSAAIMEDTTTKGKTLSMLDGFASLISFISTFLCFVIIFSYNLIIKLTQE